MAALFEERAELEFDAGLPQHLAEALALLGPSERLGPPTWRLAEALAVNNGTAEALDIGAWQAGLPA